MKLVSWPVQKPQVSPAVLRCAFIVALIGSVGLISSHRIAAEEKSATALSISTEDAEFFEAKIRPILAAHCQECHGPRKQEAHLRLDSRQAVLAGGDNGPAVRPGDPQQSLLVKAVHYGDELQMPPKGKLDESAIAALTSWVQRGVPWTVETATSRPAVETQTSRFVIRPEDRQFWSLRPVIEPPLPPVRDATWPQTAVDRFILARLDEARLDPSPPAEKRTLLRRVSFDLNGLPPTPEDIESFLGDESPDSYDRVVDRLLASPRYGERWARHWLDVARYGEDQAHTFQSRKYPEGYRYRDWLIAAFNRDLPYDDFVRQQIAADLLDGDDKLARLPALGFFACGPVYYGDKQGLDQISDRVDTLSRGFLGLTVACARCHDHKYDPISTVDYYALAGIFANSEYVETPLVSAEEVAAAEKALTEEQKKKKERPKYPFVHALKDASQPQAMRVHIRGSAENLGDEAPRRFIEVLCNSEPEPFQQGSGRLELAEAIASADNPLTSRVIVNRLWQQHFGKGLVRTPSNFGVLGERPTHPELLDWLAAELVRYEWSLKALHRRMVTSATYQQGSGFGVQGSGESGQRSEVKGQEPNPQSAIRNPQLGDPENRLLGRMNRRRLEVEAWRDAMLAVTERLDRSIGGPSGDLTSPDNRRRTLYGAVSRHELNDLLRLFDFPDPNVTAEQRPVTTVPLQQLFALNSEFMAASAKALAARLAALDVPDDAARVGRAFSLVYGRPATEREIELAVKYVSAVDPMPDGGQSEGLSRWERLCQALLSANEFMYVD